MIPVISEVASQEEIDLVSALADEIWHEHYSHILDKGQIDYMIGKFQSPRAIASQIKNGYRYYFIKLAGEPVGYMGVKKEDRSLFLSKLYILDKFRGKGYASAAFAFLEKYAADNGLSSIWLTVNRHNEKSIAVYKARGFSAVREEVSDIGSGYVMDDFIMEKKILAV